MWTCPQCRTQNQDADTVCAGCGAPRSAGRFQNQNTAPVPRVSAPGGTRQAAPARSSYPLPETGVTPRPPKRPAVCVLARFTGTVLLVLLPVLTALLAWRQYGALSRALLPLFLGTAEAQWQQTVCYAVLSLTAVLLSLLPGLWTLLLSRPMPPKDGRR